MAVSITTLGTLRIELDGHVLDRLPAARNRSALLVYLAVEREVTRDSAMGLLWPDRPPARARHLLSQTLYELRQELGEGWVEAVGERLRATTELEVDVTALAGAVESSDHDAAVELYGGPFLPGAALAVSRPMEGWVDTQQARLTRLHRRARRGAIESRVEQGRLLDALALARSWVELDPLDDEAQHRLIELLAATGDRSGALRQYEQYARLVELELELEPLAETRELLERIRDGDVGERPASVSPPAAPAPAPAPAPPGTGRDTRHTDPGTGGDARGHRRRKLVNWTLAYFAAALLLLEGTSLFTELLGWPGLVHRLLTLLLGFGALLVLGYAWVSNEARRERMGAVEALLVLAVLVFAGAAVNAARLPTPPLEAGSDTAPLDQRRLAVLFFQDYSPSQDMAPLAAGFTHALISELSRVDGLTVLSRAAVSSYRGTGTPLATIVSDLKAGTLVGGSLTTLGDRLHLTYELIDGATRNTIYSDTLQRPLDEVASLLADLPREVAISLRSELGVQIELLETRRATDNSEAWTLVQRAEAQTEFEEDVWEEDLQAGMQRLERADSMLARAERLDALWPEPPLRRAEIAATRARRLGQPPGTYAPGPTRDALSHLERALRRDGEYPRTLEARGLFRLELAEVAEAEESRMLYEQSEADLQRATDLDPSRARAWWGLSKLHRRQGSFAEAKADARRAMEADAFLETAGNNMFQMAHTALELQEHGEAAYWCDELQRRFPARGTGAYCTLWVMGSAPVLEPDPDSAWTLAARLTRDAAANQRQHYLDWSRVMVAKTLARAGMADSARSVLESHFADGTPDYAAYDAAHAWVMLGDEDRAMELLPRYVEMLPGRRASLATDWFFEALRDDPRFQRLTGTLDGPPGRR